ncbi:MAG TPA: hypothetical protein VMC09_14105 [Anaerolineales bacterium]|nr:hypothetical protein [Anaerolineales bacterium]
MHDFINGGGGMILWLVELVDWLSERESTHTGVFLVEWFCAFICVFPILFFPFLQAGQVQNSLNMLIGVPAMIALGFVYYRMMKSTGCPKCGSLLPFMRIETGRQFARMENRTEEDKKGFTIYIFGIGIPLPRWTEFYEKEYFVYRSASAARAAMRNGRKTKGAPHRNSCIPVREKMIKTAGPRI